MQADVESQISVRFRHGIHTIYLFIDPTEPFSSVSTELVSLLKERYPNGLTSTLDPEKVTPVGEAAQLVYAVLAVPNDPSRGWKKLSIGDDQEKTPSKAGLKDNSVVAFTFAADGQADDADFDVEWPKDDDEMYE